MFLVVEVTTTGRASPSTGFGGGAAFGGEKEQRQLQNVCFLKDLLENATLSFEAFFPTMAHFTPPNSSNS
jgi:hypothetical protein